MVRSKHVQPHTWAPASLGGGGYITGLIQHPADRGVLFARCDVAGMFRSTDGGLTWETLNAGLSQAHHHQVQSFAVSPHAPYPLFRCSGEVRERKFYGSVHKSVDGGLNWKEVCREMGFYGNGPTRMYGEVIAVDPHHAEVVAAGGYTGGLWISRDEGETWSRTELPDERFGCVVFHPVEPGVLYAGTISDDDLNMDYAETGKGGVLGLLQDIPRGRRGRLYRSSDLGVTWERLCEGPSFAELSLDGRNPLVMTAACIWGGIKSSIDGGRTWIRDEEGLPPGERYGLIVRDSRNPDGLITAPDIRPHMDHMPPVPVYESVDGGIHWRLLQRHGDSDLSGFPAYMDHFPGGSRAAAAGWAISKIRMDMFDPQRLYLCNWYGVAVSLDRGRTWAASGFKGLETTCMEAVTADAIQPGKFCVTMADHPPKVTEDGGRTFWNLPGIEGYSGSTAAVLSREDSSRYIYGLVGQHRRACIACSSDGGKTARAVLSLGSGLFVQALRQDGGQADTFYAYIDGKIAAGAGLYRSQDGGWSWSLTGYRPPAHVTALPHRKKWIEAELLSVVVYQVKNACGANQLLDTDPLQGGRLLLGEWTEGLWLSEDGGDTWKSVGAGLPFMRSGPESVLTAVAFSRKSPGTLYACFIKEGLWCSRNNGESWSRLYPAEESRSFNASALAIGGQGRGEDVLIVACEPMAMAGSASQVMYSPDGGTHWEDWSDSTLGALRWKGIAMDAAGTGVLGVTCGNGAFLTTVGKGIVD